MGNPTYEATTTVVAVANSAENPKLEGLLFIKAEDIALIISQLPS